MSWDPLSYGKKNKREKKKVKKEWQQYVSKSDTESKGYIPESKRERESKALEEYLEL